jgi:H3 lysine-79-specific histone-lysine N-methyltransferase
VLLGFCVVLFNIIIVVAFITFTMSFWGSKNKSGIKPAPPKIRVERIAVARKPAPLPSKLASRSQEVQRTLHSPARSSPSSSRDSPATPPSSRRDSSRLQPRKRKAQKQKSPTQQRLIESDDEDDGATSSTSYEDPHKKQRVNRPVDSKRKIRSQVAFSEEHGGNFEMIHAAEVTSAGKKSKVATNITAETVTVELVYPSASQRERSVRSRNFKIGIKVLMIS